jgi:hypothetical protein
MPRTVSTHDLRPMPRFTFAGRGCRDSRREPRRLPQAVLLHPSAGSGAAPTLASPPVTSALSGAGRPSAGRAANVTAAAEDRPPPAGLLYGPVTWQKPTNRWWSSGGATPC